MGGRRITIDDAGDPRLAAYRDLTAGPARGRDGIVVEGEVAVRRFLESGYAATSVLATPAAAERLGQACREDVPLYVAPAQLVRSVVGFEFHRGCLATGPRPVDVSELNPSLVSDLARRDGVTAVVAEGLADPANVGALARNCAAFAVDLLVIDARGADPWSRRAIRASMANVFHVPLIVCPDLGQVVDSLRTAARMTAVAATLSPDAEPLPRFPTPTKTLLLLGNEGHGLSADLAARADVKVTIPIRPAADSLNVAAAAAVLLYALRPKPPRS